MGMPRHHDRNRSDWYIVLGVEPSATLVEIRAAYRRRALALHAERLHSTAPPRTLARAYDRLNALSEAYRVLRRPETRLAYDLACETRPASVVDIELAAPPARPRYETQARMPARSEDSRRRALGRVAVVIGFGLLVLGAVAINIAERRQVEASMISSPADRAPAPAAER